MGELKENKEEIIKDLKVKILMKVHPDFRDMVAHIQNERIKSGVEDVQNKIPLYKLTKTITNLILSNPKIKDMLVGVKINKK